MSTRTCDPTRIHRPSVALVCLAASLVGLAGCAMSNQGSSKSPKPAVSADTAGTSVAGGGSITAETQTIYRATPVEVDGFEIHLASLHAQTTCTFVSEDGFRAGSDGWKMTLRLNLKDEQDGRWSRLAGPMRITSVIDDEGVDLTAKSNTKSHYSPQNVAFLRSSRRSSPSWQSLEMTVAPERLPKQLRTLRGEIPLEVVSESKVFTLPLTESREEELVPGVKVNLRVQPGEGGNAERYRRVSMTVEITEKRVPLVRSVLYSGADGRSRDIGGMNFEDGPDGIRRATFTFSADVEKGGATPAVKIDLVLAMSPFTVPFEFRGIPVGAMGK